MTCLTKRDFYGIFHTAWVNSFTEKNIQGAFRKTGIWPFSPPAVLDLISGQPETPLSTQIESAKPPPTPMTSKSIPQA